jgi:hypothetical protein
VFFVTRFVVFERPLCLQECLRIRIIWGEKTFSQSSLQSGLSFHGELEKNSGRKTDVLEMSRLRSRSQAEIMEQQCSAAQY